MIMFVVFCVVVLVVFGGKGRPDVDATIQNIRAHPVRAVNWLLDLAVLLILLMVGLAYLGSVVAEVCPNPNDLACLIPH